MLWLIKPCLHGIVKQVPLINPYLYMSIYEQIRNTILLLLVAIMLIWIYLGNWLEGCHISPVLKWHSHKEFVMLCLEDESGKWNLLSQRNPLQHVCKKDSRQLISHVQAAAGFSRCRQYWNKYNPDSGRILGSCEQVLGKPTWEIFKPKAQRRKYK